MTAKTSSLSAHGLVAGYGSTPSINGIDLLVSPSTGAIGIIGRSGVGKTTLIKTMTGELKARGGRVNFDGATVGRLGMRDKKRFGVAVRSVAQNGFSGLDGRQTVEKAIEGELAKARKAGRATGASAEGAIAVMFLEPRFLKRTISSLSGGERQRLALAAALSTRPDILLLDEPTTALDQSLKDAVSRRLAEIVEENNIGLLVASHDLDLINRLCPTVHVLDGGTFVETGSVQELLNTPKHAVTRELALVFPETTGTFA
ncbi:ABC-type dipeptide/oligopeptide/nickel transport system, ATPase component [Sanguibacter gelidistatuariae]|uniref:ABC-type dipeptide/oligopeptide/nickel transport system, ATPase component n=1 Tax=Sanguibacter gelidistatuariae TaxID=1814289 RepID=A0A1G6UJ50_9MICO|nr:ATP-binding cassette domain-containing protein [Sanguibacter gelidistatuariae]SDD40746.1 ABC-type dipeptide/oligopeptide/nickel transport system, ATPase component [Sanguibacter gelidistatuariae]